jgi:hypothetical protein
MIPTFLTNLLDAGLLLLFFFIYFSHLHVFLCFEAYLKRIFILLI